MTKSFSIRKAITSFHYLHTQTNHKKHMSLCPSGWYQFLKMWHLAHALSHFPVFSTLQIYAVPGNHTINYSSLSSAPSQFMLYQETTPSITLPCPQHAPNICCSRKPHNQSHFPVLSTLPIYAVAGSHTINHTSLSSARSKYMLYQETTPSITLPYRQHAPNICCSRKPLHQSRFPVLSTLPIYAVAGSHIINHTPLSSARSQYMLYQETTPSITLPSP